MQRPLTDQQILILLSIYSYYEKNKAKIKAAKGTIGHRHYSVSFNLSDYFSHKDVLEGIQIIQNFSDQFKIDFIMDTIVHHDKNSREADFKYIERYNRNAVDKGTMDNIDYLDDVATAKDKWVLKLEEITKSDLDLFFYLFNWKCMGLSNLLSVNSISNNI